MGTYFEPEKNAVHLFCQPVRVSNESYFLFDTEVPTVPSLCDAFKYRPVVILLHLSLSH